MPSLNQRSGAKTRTKVLEADFQPPPFTLRSLHAAIPKHCFQRSLVRSSAYLVTDIALLALFASIAVWFHTNSNYYGPLVQSLFWLTYWVFAGVVATGLWVIAHECGHQAFSNYSLVNNIFGFILHSALLVPYFSWQISHAKHHQNTGHMERDQVFIPQTKDEALKLFGPYLREDDEEGYFEVAPLFTLYKLTTMVLLGWPAYLLYHVTGPKYEQFTSHFLPSSPIFDSKQRKLVVLSNLGILTTLVALAYASSLYGFGTVVKFYGIPYLIVNFWLVTITFLQHTDIELPHYRGEEWNFVKGALSTIDRDYGWILNKAFHHIGDTHVAHHLFSNLPHYHAEEATKHLKKVLGPYYMYRNENILKSLWKSSRQCLYVEKNGNIVFYKY